MLQGKKIILGITGSIAAYKAAILLRLLVKAGAEVKVVMTASAKDFVAPLTYSTLSKNPVYSEFRTADGTWNNHVDMADWADLILIAPASANTIAKMANGLCDNLLLATYLSASCPVYVAPAMDREMYTHKATLANLEKLRSFKNIIIPAEDGELASGLHGEGRMAEPEHIIAFLQKKNVNSLHLKGKKALVTAGPTFEAIDPVRFIGNFSSGKMGIAIAEKLASEGAEVTLVHGPIHTENINKSIKSIAVTSAEEMHKACIAAFAKADITVMSAAVADFRPTQKATEKIKKVDAGLTLKLEHTPDILSELGKKKKTGQLLIGFALETNNEQKNAADKLKRKNLDAIVLNSMRSKGAGPGGDTNKITIIDKHNKVRHFELKSKIEVANDIVTYIISCLKK
ncbi:MAG TPA: bifunctional phosphopantothenoylcysteine decarboxylase/phosphopantothenate--cysteine ligase CoaBC [Bacteroidia bacterium]|nr:bifunctional phosphopantothenoylcysteine decarboxylase/phosphopantothenate--cysteine ligase CoaBC [Bacteroidia bacterium]